MDVLESSNSSDLTSINPSNQTVSSGIDIDDPTNSILPTQTLTFSAYPNGSEVNISQAQTINNLNGLFNSVVPTQTLTQDSQMNISQAHPNDLLFTIAHDNFIPNTQTKSDLQIELLRLQIQAIKREMYLRELEIIQLETTLALTENDKQDIQDKLSRFF